LKGVSPSEEKSKGFTSGKEASGDTETFPRGPVPRFEGPKKRGVISQATLQAWPSEKEIHIVFENCCGCVRGGLEGGRKRDRLIKRVIAVTVPPRLETNDHHT